MPKNLYITESQFQRMIVREYLDKDYNMPLVQYFKWAAKAPDDEKIRDILSQMPHTTIKFVERYCSLPEEYPELYEKIKEEYDDCGYVETEEYMETLVKAIEEDASLDELISFVQNIGDYPEWPAWMTMDFHRIVKNEWCIHFGADSFAIAKEGFTDGTEEIDRLAYTGAGRLKGHAGYNFAYSLKTCDNRIDTNNYGKQAVVFRTSGVEVWHHGDEEYQVIFDGKQAKDFVPFAYEDGEWVIPGSNDYHPIYKADDPSDVAYWIMRNYQQYARQILYGKNGLQPRKNKWGRTLWR